MLKYRQELKATARTLRVRMTDAEQLVWSRLRRKQVHGVQFYRQKPIGGYIVDFHAPAAKLVIEVDGSQHHADAQVVHDRERDLFLEANGLSVLRFDNRQVLTETEAVMRVIHETVEAALRSGIFPLVPPIFDVQEAQVPRAHECAEAAKGEMRGPEAASGPDESVPPIFDVQEAQVPRAHECAEAAKGKMRGPEAASGPGDSVPPFEKGGAGGI